jgi:hypothetical protein
MLHDEIGKVLERCFVRGMQAPLCIGALDRLGHVEVVRISGWPTDGAQVNVLGQYKVADTHPVNWLIVDSSGAHAMRITLHEDDGSVSSDDGTMGKPMTMEDVATLDAETKRGAVANALIVQCIERGLRFPLHMLSLTATGGAILARFERDGGYIRSRVLWETDHRKRPFMPPVYGMIVDDAGEGHQIVGLMSNAPKLY